MIFERDFLLNILNKINSNSFIFKITNDNNSKIYIENVSKNRNNHNKIFSILDIDCLSEQNMTFQIPNKQKFENCLKGFPKQTKIMFKIITKDNEKHLMIIPTDPRLNFKYTFYGIILNCEIPKTEKMIDPIIFELSAEEFQEKTKYLKTFTYTEQDRIFLNGILFERAYDQTNSNLSLVATDGRRLAVDSIQLHSVETEKKFDFIVSSNLIELINKYPKKQGLITFFVDTEQNLIQVNFDGLRFITNLLDGKFPNYRQVIPEKIELSFRIDAIELKKFMEICVKHTDLKSGNAKFIIDKEMLKLYGSDPETGSVSIETPIKIHQKVKEFEFALHVKFLLETLKNIKKSESVDVQFDIQASQSPILVTYNNNDSLQVILMPIKIYADSSENIKPEIKPTETETTETETTETETVETETVETSLVEDIVNDFIEKIYSEFDKYDKTDLINAIHNIKEKFNLNDQQSYHHYYNWQNKPKIDVLNNTEIQPEKIIDPQPENITNEVFQADNNEFKTTSEVSKLKEFFDIKKNYYKGKGIIEKPNIEYLANNQNNTCKVMWKIACLYDVFNDCYFKDIFFKYFNTITECENYVNSFYPNLNWLKSKNIKYCQQLESCWIETENSIFEVEAIDYEKFLAIRENKNNEIKIDDLNDIEFESDKNINIQPENIVNEEFQAENIIKIKCSEFIKSLPENWNYDKLMFELHEVIKNQNADIFNEKISQLQ